MSLVPSFKTARPGRPVRTVVQQAMVSLLALSAAVLTACGGGGSDGVASSSESTTTTAATSERATAYAAGPISGFGSVIVNGVRYDDSGATVTDDDGRARSREHLKLGMLVELDSAALDAASATGRALRIRFGSEIIGPVTAVDAGAGTLSVLGQAVTVSATTVFDDSLVGGLSGITAGEVLEVHALYNASTGSYTAVRVEDAAAATTYKLRGLVANLDTTAKTFTLGGQTINYAALPAADVPSSLANGASISVRLQTTAVNNQWVATALRSGLRKPDNGLGAHLRGAITAFTSATAFEVNGIPVDAGASTFPDGQSGVVLGAVVEVHGTATNGVVVATRVELDSRHAPERHRFELHGTISELNSVAKTFKLRGITVNYSGTAIEWKDGTETTLANGAAVEVKGTPSADRTQLVATKIDFE